MPPRVRVRTPPRCGAAAVSFGPASGYSRKPRFRGTDHERRPVPSLAELDRRIAIARDNIRQLIEQAAAFSGAEDEDRNADRIAQQTEELEKLIKQRDDAAEEIGARVRMEPARGP